MALAMAAGLSGLVAGEASAYPNRGWDPGPGHGWNQATNRVDVVVWAKQTTNSWGNDRWGNGRWDNDRWGNGRRGNDRWGNGRRWDNGPRWSSAPRVYAVETYTGRYAGTATLVSTDRSGGMLGYRYVFRNLPWDTILKIRVSGPGSYVGMDDLYLPRRTSGSLDLSATFNQV